MFVGPDSSASPGPDPIDPTGLLGLGGLALFEHLATIGSTMERARELAVDPTRPLPALVVADRQLAGRGRRGAGWWQADGSLAASIVVETGAAGETPPPTWSLACGVALAESVAAVAPGVEALVRWPNDVEVSGRKLAGILVETAPRGRAVFGIGMNTMGASRDAPPPLASRIVTMPDLTGVMLPRQRVLGDFLPRFLRLLAEMRVDPAAFVPRYRRCCGLRGYPVTVHQAARRLSGVCRGIADDGALVLDTSDGTVHVHSGSLTDPADVWRGR